jgi:hypothetical protein
MTELPNPHEAEVLSSLVKHIDAAKHKLRIFSGEANCNIYNRTEVEAALERAYQRGVQIQIIAGPILSICPGGRSVILEKAQRKELELYFRNRRTTECHFCIADETMGTRQEPHPPMTGYSSPPEPIPLNDLQKYIEKFDKYITTGLGSYNDHSFTVCLSHAPKRDFLLLTPHEIKQADKTIGEYLNNLTKSEIERRLLMLKWQITSMINWALLMTLFIFCGSMLGWVAFVDSAVDRSFLFTLTILLFIGAIYGLGDAIFHHWLLYKNKESSE